MIIRRPRWGRRVAGACAAIAIAIFAAACGGPAESGSGTSKGPGGVTNLTLGYVPYTDDAALFYAQDGGIFRSHGLNVKFVPQASPVAVEASMASGTEQFGFVTTPVLVNLNSKGAPAKCVSSVDGNQPATAAGDHTVLVAAKGSGIKSIADLKGKNVAEVQLTSLNSLAVQVLAKRAGIDPASIHQIAMPFPQMPAALSQGRVQAAVIVAPFADAALADGATVLTHPNADLFPNGTVTCLDAMGPYLKANPKVASDFRAAMNAAIAYCHGHQSACKATLASHLSLPPAKAAKAALSTNWNPALNPASITLIEGYMKEFGQITSEPPASSMIWNP
jgi:NitT/TauT family transport system substrate-binding protein